MYEDSLNLCNNLLTLYSDCVKLYIRVNGPGHLEDPNNHNDSLTSSLQIEESDLAEYKAALSSRFLVKLPLWGKAKAIKIVEKAKVINSIFISNKEQLDNIKTRLSRLIRLLKIFERDIQSVKHNQEEYERSKDTDGAYVMENLWKEGKKSLKEDKDKINNLASDIMLDFNTINSSIRDSL